MASYGDYNSNVPMKVFSGQPSLHSFLSNIEGKLQQDVLCLTNCPKDCAQAADSELCKKTQKDCLMRCMSKNNQSC